MVVYRNQIFDPSYGGPVALVSSDPNFLLMYEDRISGYITSDIDGKDNLVYYYKREDASHPEMSLYRWYTCYRYIGILFISKVW